MENASWIKGAFSNGFLQEGKSSVAPRIRTEKRALCLGINAYGVILYKDTNSSQTSQRTYPQRIKLYCESSPCRDQVNLTSGTSVDSESCQMTVSWNGVGLPHILKLHSTAAGKCTLPAVGRSAIRPSRYTAISGDQAGGWSALDANSKPPLFQECRIMARPFSEVE